MTRQVVLSRQATVQIAAQMAMAISLDNIGVVVFNDVDRVFEDNHFSDIFETAVKVTSN